MLSALQLALGYDTDILAVRCVKQVMSLALYVAIVQYLTFKVARDDLDKSADLSRHPFNSEIHPDITILDASNGKAGQASNT